MFHGHAHIQKTFVYIFIISPKHKNIVSVFSKMRVYIVCHLVFRQINQGVGDISNQTILITQTIYGSFGYHRHLFSGFHIVYLRIKKSLDIRHIRHYPKKLAYIYFTDIESQVLMSVFIRSRIKTDTRSFVIQQIYFSVNMSVFPEIHIIALI